MGSERRDSAFFFESPVLETNVCSRLKELPVEPSGTPRVLPTVVDESPEASNNKKKIRDKHYMARNLSSSAATDMQY